METKSDDSSKQRKGDKKDELIKDEEIRVKEYRIIAIADVVFRGISEDDAKQNFMLQAETLDVENWRFIHVEEMS